MITSKNNQQIKRIRQLLESSRTRKELGLFVVEGTRLASEAPSELIDSVFVSESLSKEGFGCIPGDYQTEIIADSVFRSISDTVNPQGILAICRMPQMDLERASDEQLCLILDDVRDPGNLGTIIRTAEAAGAGVIMSPGCVDVFNPKVIRATMGSIFRVPLAVSDAVGAVRYLQEKGTRVFAAALDGSVPYKEADYGEANAFVIGNEAYGVSTAVQNASDYRVRIPMKGRVESLNAAVSAAVLLYGLTGKI